MSTASLTQSAPKLQSSLRARKQLIIQKFGGTSIANVEQVRRIAQRIAQTKHQGYRVVVVLSAMGDRTDQLAELARAIAPFPSPREWDVLLSTGELVSVALMSMALQALGLQARSYTGYQAGIGTDTVHKMARIKQIDETILSRDLEEGIIPVVAGFQGVDALGNITTLGRGGSDTTAVALAVVLKAQECQIYTDVQGVYTADPRIVTQARLLKEVTFEEMLEMSSLGAKVLQIRSVEVAAKHNVPVRVMSSFSSEVGSATLGTLITYEEKEMEQPLVSGVTCDKNQAQLTITELESRLGVVGQLFHDVANANILVDMIVQSAPLGAPTMSVSFTVPREDYQIALRVAKQFMTTVGSGQLQGEEKVVKLSVVGVGMRSHMGVADTLFSTLAQEGIRIHLVSTSEIKISVLVEEKYVELGTRVLHAAFGLDDTG